MTEWNDAIAAAEAAIPDQAAKLATLRRPDTTSCLHPELTFDSGDYYVFCHTCNSKWVRVNMNWPESGLPSRQVGGDPGSANIGAASGLSGHKRVEPK